MKTVCILHDSYSSSNEPWIVAVADQLRVRGNTVFTPNFPTPIGQDYIAWKHLFHNSFESLDSHSIIVCVGVGCAFLLRYLLESHDISFDRVVFVAPFIQSISSTSENMVASSFLLSQYDWDDLNNRIRDVAVYVSSNDSLVPKSHSLYVATQLRTRLVEVTNMGHFRAIDGVRDFPEIISAIESLTPIKQNNPKEDEVKIQVELPKAIVTSVDVVQNISNIQNVETSKKEPVMTNISFVRAIPVLEIHKKNAIINKMPHSEFEIFDNESVPVSPDKKIPISVVELQSIQAPSIGIPHIAQTLKEEEIKKIQHSLVQDFSQSLINANPAEVASTLKDYREGKEIEEEIKTVSKKRFLIIFFTVVILFLGFYFVYIGYTQSKPIAIIETQESIPLQAKDTKEISFDPSTTISGDIIKIIRKNMARFTISTGDIGIVSLFNTKNNAVFSTSDIYTILLPNTTKKLSPLLHTNSVVGVIKDEIGFTPFIVSRVTSKESLVNTVIKEIELSIPENMIEFFSPEYTGDNNEKQISIINRIVGNHQVKVFVLSPETDLSTMPQDKEKILPELINPEKPTSIRLLSASQQKGMYIASDSLSFDLDAPILSEILINVGDTLIFENTNMSKLLEKRYSIRVIESATQSNSVVEYKTKTINLDSVQELVRRVGDTVYDTENLLTSSLVAKKQQQELFSYSIANGSLLIITGDSKHIPAIVQAYQDTEKKQ